MFYIIENSGHAEFAKIIADDEGANRTFGSYDEADEWLMDYGDAVGTSYKIVEAK